MNKKLFPLFFYFIHTLSMIKRNRWKIISFSSGVFRVDSLADRKYSWSKSRNPDLSILLGKHTLVREKRVSSGFLEVRGIEAARNRDSTSSVLFSLTKKFSVCPFFISVESQFLDWSTHARKFKTGYVKSVQKTITKRCMRIWNVWKWLTEIVRCYWTP